MIMNNEIKEILDKSKICKNCKYHFLEEISFDYPQSCCDRDKDKKQCYTTEEWCTCERFEYSDDYITNLQQENERLKAQNTRYEVKMNCLIQENDILKENAEHNDKVVDKAKWNETIYKSRCEKAIELINVRYNEQKHYDKRLKDLLNILQGSDKE